MENYKIKIEEVLTQALTEKTFSLEIIEKIKSLKDGFEASQLLLKTNTEVIDNLNKQIIILRKDQESLNEYKKRESEIKDKENSLAKKDYELEFQKNRANEIKELMTIVFRNPTILENSCRNYTDQSGNYRTDNISVNKTVN